MCNLRPGLIKWWKKTQLHIFSFILQILVVTGQRRPDGPALRTTWTTWWRSTTAWNSWAECTSSGTTSQLSLTPEGMAAFLFFVYYFLESQVNFRTDLDLCSQPSNSVLRTQDTIRCYKSRYCWLWEKSTYALNWVIDHTLTFEVSGALLRETSHSRPEATISGTSLGSTAPPPSPGVQWFQAIVEGARVPFPLQGRPSYSTLTSHPNQTWSTRDTYLTGEQHFLRKALFPRVGIKIFLKIKYRIARAARSFVLY